MFFGEKMKTDAKKLHVLHFDIKIFSVSVGDIFMSIGNVGFYVIELTLTKHTLYNLTTILEAGNYSYMYYSQYRRWPR